MDVVFEVRSEQIGQMVLVYARILPRAAGRSLYNTETRIGTSTALVDRLEGGNQICGVELILTEPVSRDLVRDLLERCIPAELVIELSNAIAAELIRPKLNNE